MYTDILSDEASVVIINIKIEVSLCKRYIIQEILSKNTQKWSYQHTKSDEIAVWPCRGIDFFCIYE